MFKSDNPAGVSEVGDRHWEEVDEEGDRVDAVGVVVVQSCEMVAFTAAAAKVAAVPKVF